MDIDYNEDLGSGSDGSVILADEEIENKLVPRSQRHWTAEKTARIMQEFRSSWIPPGLEVTETPPATPTKLEEENLSMNVDDMIQLAKQVVQERDEATVRADAAQAELYRLRKLMMAVGEDLHGLATAISSQST